MSLIQSFHQNKKTLTYILGWYVFSLLILVYNKWMFGSGLDFRFPIIVTAFHQLVLVLISAFVLYLTPSLRPIVNENTNSNLSIGSFFRVFKISPITYARTILPCALASSGDIGLSNVSFRFVSLSLYTMLKTSSLVFVLIFGLLFKLERFNWRLVVIVLVMFVGVMMMVSKPSETVDENQSFGVILVLSASLISGLRWSFTQLLLKHNPHTPNPISTIFYILPSMCVALLSCGLVFEGWGNFVLSEIWTIHGIFGTLLLMLIPGVLAFMMTLCEFKLLSVAQVITLSIAGIFKELLTITVGTIVFGDKLSLVNVLGLGVTLIDILWYNWFRYSENEEKDSEELELDNTSEEDYVRVREA